MRADKVSYDYLFLLNNPVQAAVNGVNRIVTDCSIYIEFTIKQPDTVLKEPYRLLDVSINSDGVSIRRNPKYAYQQFAWRVTEYEFGIYTGEKNLVCPDGTIEMPLMVDGEPVGRELFEQFVIDNLDNLQNSNNIHAQTTCYTIREEDSSDQIRLYI